MNFIDLARKRYSCRKYSDRKISREQINLILEAGRIAPSAKNRQPWHTIVVDEPDLIEKMKDAARFYGAPLLFIVCTNHQEAWIREIDRKPIGDIDNAIFTTHMMLQAEDMGLNSLWIGYFKPDVIAKLFPLPDNIEPVSILAVGYGEETPQLPGRHDELRKSINKIASFNKY